MKKKNDWFRVNFLHQEYIRIASPLAYSDWQIIQTAEYWMIRDQLESEEERLMFTMDRIIVYRFSLCAYT